MTNYLGREGIIRAIASAGQPIALGYTVATAIGLYLYLQKSITPKISSRMGALLLFLGLLAPLSRGPWVGTVCIILVFIITGKQIVKRLSFLLLAGVTIIPLIIISPVGEKVINLIPFIGETEKFNVDYRGRLFVNSMTVIKRHPWFGSVDYLETPEMESMRQGQGIIDIVNTYIQVTLESGFIGAGLFIGFFLTICWGIYRGFRRLQDKSTEEYLLGRALLATIAGTLVIIATVSSITVIPIVYWSIAGLGAAYINMTNRLRSDQYEHGKQLTKDPSNGNPVV
jgi:O-antigen ligase